MADIFTYLDYRRYLQDSIEERQRLQPRFSLRLISQRMGIRSMGFLSMVLSGKRNISEKLIIALGKIFKLNKKEQQYFRSLVYFNQAQTHVEKDLHYRQLLSYQSGPVRTVTRDKYEFYDKWYYAALRELVALYDITDDCDEVGKLLTPPCKSSEVKTALAVLERLGFIKKNDRGVYQRVSAIITSGRTAHALEIQNFQITTLELAKRAFDLFTKEQRELSTLTMSIDGAALDVIKGKLSNLRAEIMELARSVQRPDQVFQLNMQLFPLSTKKEENTHGI
jgi:uncharacterized protein (TIGR02147 family)